MVHIYLFLLIPFLMFCLSGCVPTLGSELLGKDYLTQKKYIHLNQVPTRQEVLQDLKNKSSAQEEKYSQDVQQLQEEKESLKREMEEIREKTL